MNLDIRYDDSFVMYNCAIRFPNGLQVMKQETDNSEAAKKNTRHWGIHGFKV
jgi:hypothetical protein